MKNSLITLIFLHLVFWGASQNNLNSELKFEVNRNYPAISITKEKLNDAQILIDLNPRYKSSWVRAYNSVEILTTYQGKKRKAMSKNDTLSQEQKDLIKMADAGTDISVKVKYLPENTLKQNDIKEIHFTFTVEPENEATYYGGQQQLNQYLKDHAIDKIPDGSFKGYDLTAIKFTIDEEGQIVDAHVFGAGYQNAKNEKINNLLLETIRKMPCWKPAAYANGVKVKQEFVLTVGNMENCMVNLLNIYPSKFTSQE